MVELMKAFESGQLVRPSADALNIVDFANALASLAGVSDVRLTSGASKIAEIIGPADHLVFVMIDGLGMSLVRDMPGGAFIPSRVAAVLRTVFPSTTPVVATTLATGKWPSEHAVVGWETYVPEIDAAATIIRFQDRKSERPLSEMGLKPEQAYPVRSQMGRTPRDFLALLPESIVGSAYSNYWTGGKAQLGCKTLREAADAALQRVARAASQTFTYIYTSQVDFNAHACGVRHSRTRAQAREVNEELERLAERLPRNARLVATADHGLLDAAREQAREIPHTDELLRCLRKEPSGDRRVMYFDVREDELSAFERLFSERFGERFVLVSTADAEQLELFGPGKLSAATRNRLGNLIAISRGADLLDYRWPDKKDDGAPKVSHHSGLSPDEMLVPLIVA
ncbi:MAG: alkaline phosphatase family protein [Chloroflexi bacterium]|nr:alkaline phosphatase family protein [Chloroflexota bacterium]